MTKQQISTSRVRWFCAVLLLALCTSLHCAPAEHPTPEFPPCVVESSLSTESGPVELSPSIVVSFSKELQEPSTNNVFLVRGVVDAYFLSDLESPPVSSTREELLVPINIKINNSGGKTKITVSPKSALQGDTDYVLVLTRAIRDKIQVLSENRRSGNRPLNQCPDSSGVWLGDLSSYRTGVSSVLRFRTVARKGSPRITEVMSEPPNSIKNGRFVEITNVDTKDALDLRGLFLDNESGSPREIIPFPGQSTGTIPAGGRAVVLEPDYSMSADPYGLKGRNIRLFTTRGSTSTMLSGGLANDAAILLLQGTSKVLERVSPQDVSQGGKWPKDKSLERCDPRKANNTSNWAPSNAANGTPGRKNNATCS